MSKIAVHVIDADRLRTAIARLLAGGWEVQRSGPRDIGTAMLSSAAELTAATGLDSSEIAAMAHTMLDKATAEVVMVGDYRGKVGH